MDIHTSAGGAEKVRDGLARLKASIGDHLADISKVVGDSPDGLEPVVIQLSVVARRKGAPEVMSTLAMSHVNSDVITCEQTFSVLQLIMRRSVMALSQLMAATAGGTREATTPPTRSEGNDLVN